MRAACGSKQLCGASSRSPALSPGGRGISRAVPRTQISVWRVITTSGLFQFSFIRVVIEMKPQGQVVAAELRWQRREWIGAADATQRGAIQRHVAGTQDPL